MKSIHPDNIKLDQHYLDMLKPSYIDKGYPVPKWIQFSETLMNEGWGVYLQRSKTTISKYIHIFKGHQHFKIRFSNHKASKCKEDIGDCDFYVGVGNNGVLTTEQVIKILTET